MPLDEREQRILEEIERQFYQEDPKLAQTVAKTTLESVNRKWQRLAAVGFVVGLVVMLAFFPVSTFVAAGGFVVMVASAGWLAMNIRRARGESSSNERLESWLDRVRQRWRNDG
jgi:Flp pilus assembly protein TadB